MKNLTDKFAVGRIFAIPDAQPNIAHAGPLQPAGFRTVMSPAIHLAHSKGSFFKSDRVSDFKAGQSGDAHRNFIWLPYIPGYVSEVVQANLPVITGPLSGCPVIRYRRNGTTYVGHVGTEDNPNSPATINAKTYWNNFVAGVPPGNRAGCNVARDLGVGGIAPMQAGDGAVKFWAIVMANGDFYGLAAYSQYTDVNKSRPIPVPAGGVGGISWWRVAVAPAQIVNSGFPANGVLV
jgi:hypothetical protein